MFTPRVHIEQSESLTMEPVSGPVRGLVGAVAPDGANLLPADALPHLLAEQDGVLGGNRCARAPGHDAIGDGGRLAVHLAPEEAEHAERAEEGYDE